MLPFPTRLCISFVMLSACQCNILACGLCVLAYKCLRWQHVSRMLALFDSMCWPVRGSCRTDIMLERLHVCCSGATDVPGNVHINITLQAACLLRMQALPPQHPVITLAFLERLHAAHIQT